MSNASKTRQNTPLQRLRRAVFGRLPTAFLLCHATGIHSAHAVDLYHRPEGLVAVGVAAFPRKGALYPYFHQLSSMPAQAITLPARARRRSACTPTRNVIGFVVLWHLRKVAHRAG